ncbi:MAG: carbohydrate kinase family protein [Alistipes sp.]
MKKFDVIAIGELNVDLILNRIDGQPEIGKEKFAKDMLLTLGSSTAIFAANAAALGTKTGFAGMIGRDLFGNLVKRDLQDKGVDTQFLIESETAATGATIVMNYDEDRANITYQGAMDQMRFTDIDPQVFTDTNHIHLSSLFMQRGLLLDIETLLRHAKVQGVTTSLDTQWDPTDQWAFDYRKLLPLIDVFMPNDKELMALTHQSSLEDAIGAITPFLGHAAIIKCGREGSILVLRNGTRHSLAACLNSHVVDAIGAGDSFNAGFIHRFVQGCPLTDCQQLGNLTGAISTTAAGGTGAFFNREHIEKIAWEVFHQTIEL